VMAALVNNGNSDYTIRPGVEVRPTNMKARENCRN
jgi:hypothetical protein